MVGDVVGAVVGAGVGAWVGAWVGAGTGADVRPRKKKPENKETCTFFYSISPWLYQAITIIRDF